MHLYWNLATSPVSSLIIVQLHCNYSIKLNPKHKHMHTHVHNHMNALCTHACTCIHYIHNTKQRFLVCAHDYRLFIWEYSRISFHDFGHNANNARGVILKMCYVQGKYVCMTVYLCICARAHMCAYVYMCVCAYVCVCMSVWMHAFVLYDELTCTF